MVKIRHRTDDDRQVRRQFIARDRLAATESGWRQETRRQTFAAESTAALGIFMQMAMEVEALLWHLMASVCVTLQHGPASSGTQRWRGSSFPFPSLSILFQKVRLLTIPTLWLAPVEGSVTEAHSHLNWPSSVMTDPGVFSLLTSSLVRIRDKGYHK